MTSDQGVTGERDVLPAFSKLAYYSDVETSDTEDDHHFVPPPVTPELLAALLKQVCLIFDPSPSSSSLRQNGIPHVLTTG